MLMRISVIMTSYNYAKYISEAIESVINQTYTDWELVIVDDASTDNSVEIIQTYLEKDNRIKLYINNENLGLAKSIQKALKHTNSEWIAFLESDDKFYPNTLEKKIDVIKKHDVDLIYSDVELSKHSAPLDEHFDIVKTKYLNTSKNCFIEDFDKIIPKENIIPTFSVVMLKKSLLASCSFSSPCKALLDYYLWVQLYKAKVFYINKPLTFWRVHEDSYINKIHYNEFQKLLFRTSIVFYTSSIINAINYFRRYFVTIKRCNGKIKFVFCNGGEKSGYSI